MIIVKEHSSKKKSLDRGNSKKESYKGHRMSTSDVDDAFEELVDKLGADTVAQELLNWMSSSEQADALTSIYVDYDLIDETEYVD